MYKLIWNNLTKILFVSQVKSILYLYTIHFVYTGTHTKKKPNDKMHKTESTIVFICKNKTHDEKDTKEEKRVNS